MKFSLPQHAFGKLRENVHEYGIRETLERSCVWVAKRLVAPTFHRHNRPSLLAFAEAAASMHFSVEELSRRYVFGPHRVSEAARVQAEFEALCEELELRYAERACSFPPLCGVERGSAFLLYTMVRVRRPSVVLETGVANGHSSFFILRALLANGSGVLHSVDRFADVGGLLTEEEREVWCLHVLRAKDLKKSFLEILEALPSVDLFLHDSDHNYPWESFELQAALKKLSPNGILAADDCDSCFAFLDTCRETSFRPVFLVDTRKVFGLLFREPVRLCATGRIDRQRDCQSQLTSD